MERKGLPAAAGPLMSLRNGTAAPQLNPDCAPY